MTSTAPQAPTRWPRLPAVDSPWFNPDAFADPGRRSQAEHLHEHGYLLLEGAIDQQLIDRAIAETEPLFQPGVDDGPRSSYRCQDAWEQSAATKAIASDPTIVDTLSSLYGRTAFPFQTLTFRTGSQQRAHADTIHFNSLPARYMCAAWVAMEDISAESGPLFYYPDSHTLPEFGGFELGAHPSTLDYIQYEDAMETAMARSPLTRRVFTPKKGDVFLWSANLVHGGQPVHDESLTRWSQVTHYYFDNCVYYAPRYSDSISGARALRDVTNIATGQPVPHMVDSQPIRRDDIDPVRTHVRFHEPYVAPSGRQGMRELKRAGSSLTEAARGFGAALRNRLGR